MGMNTAAVQRLYVAYFNRPADPLAIGDYEAMLPADRVATQAELQVLAEKFFSPSLEYQAQIDGLGNADIVNQLYLNIFGRTADIDGLKGWTAALNAGTETVASLALQLSYSAQGTDATVVAARIEAATAFTNGLDTAEEILAYQGPDALAAATAYLEQISGELPTTDEAITAQKTAAIANVDTTIAGVVAVGGPEGTTFELKVGFDDIEGTAKNDTIVGLLTGAATQTLTDIDIIKGGDGRDTLQLTDTAGGTALPGGMTMSEVENVTARSTGAVAVDLTGSVGVTGVTLLASTASTTSTLTAAATTDLSVKGASGAIITSGGKDVVVSDASAATDITVGTAAGKVTINATNATSSTVKATGGTDVTVNVAGSTGGGDTIEVGQGGAAAQASGTVKVTSTAGAANGDATLHAIKADGGSTITVTQGADLSKAAADTAGTTITQGAVTAIGGAKTTEVTSVQSTTAAETLASAATAGVTETAKVVFTALTAGQTVIIGPVGAGNKLTFTASAAMTKEQVAAAFANILPNTVYLGDTQSGGAASKGTYTGVLKGYTSGAASGDTVTFTSVTAETAVDDLQATGTGTATATTLTDGVTAAKAVAGVRGFKNGTVLIDDDTTASITTVSVDGYGDNSKLGDTTTLSKLASLTLANSGGTNAGDTDATMSVDAAAVTTLDLSLNAIAGAVTLDAGVASVKTLNVTTTGAKSGFALTAAAVEGLTVTGDQALDLTGSTLTALKTVTVTGTAGLTVDASGAAVTSVDSTGTTGAVTATVDASKATFTGGAGKDTVILDATTVSKGVSTGGGDDTVSIKVGTTALAATVSGGADTDTVSMNSATATVLSADVAFEGKIDGFEKLNLLEVADDVQDSVNLANIDGISNVISAGTSDTQQVKAFTITPAGATVSDANQKYAVTVNGTVFESAALGANATGAQIAAALALVDASITAAGAVVSVTAAVGEVVDVSVAKTTAGASNAAFSAPAVTSSQLTLTNMADGGTLTLVDAGVGANIVMTDATGTGDILNIAAASAGNLNVGTVAVDGVETINITSLDTEVPAPGATATANDYIIGLDVNDKTTTVNVSGGNQITLNLDKAVAVTTIDGSEMTDVLVATSKNVTTATTIKGGSAADFLTAATGTTADVLIGGDGDDTLASNAGLGTMTGGAGSDVFDIAVASANVNTYTTIADFTAGDLIKLAGADSFSNVATSLGDTAVFQDFANKAIEDLGANDAGFFYFGGNTYVVMDAGADTAAFVNAQDFIVKLTGVVDLTTASFNDTTDTIGL